MKYVKGNLLDMFDNQHFDAIVHGCNCFHAMKAGIARQIADRYPLALWSDINNSVYGDKGKLGGYTLHHDTQSGGLIFNAYTQYHYGSPKGGNVLCDYEAVERFFLTLNDTLKPGSKVGIPKIGAGLAGGDWNIIEKIIDNCTPDLQVTCVLYDR